MPDTTTIDTAAETQDIIEAVVARHETPAAPARRSFQARQKAPAVILKPLTKSASAGIAEAIMAPPKTDHINALEKCSSGIEKELGNFLGFDSEFPFFHPDFTTTFNSIRGFSGVINAPSRLDFFRTASGAVARNAIYETRGEYIPNFRQVIAEAVWYKVLSYPDMAARMAETNAVFTSYFYRRSPGTQPFTSSTPESSWYCMILEEIRDTLKLRENEPDEEKKALIEPDFSKIPKSNVYRGRY